MSDPGSGVKDSHLVVGVVVLLAVAGVTLLAVGLMIAEALS